MCFASQNGIVNRSHRFEGEAIASESEVISMTKFVFWFVVSGFAVATGLAVFALFAENPQPFLVAAGVLAVAHLIASVIALGPVIWAFSSLEKEKRD